jgi:hypothetical protein
MGAKGAVAPKAPDQVFGECSTALEVRSFSRLPAVQSAELYLLYLPNTLPPAGAHRHERGEQEADGEGHGVSFALLR